MLKTFTFIFRWRDGNPSSWPVEAPNLLQAVRDVFRRTNLDAHGGLLGMDVIGAGRTIYFRLDAGTGWEQLTGRVLPMPRAFWDRRGNVHAQLAEVARG